MEKGPTTWSEGNTRHIPKGCGRVEREGAPHEEGPKTHSPCTIISINSLIHAHVGFKGDVRNKGGTH
jgi:hypothetical protein